MGARGSWYQMDIHAQGLLKTYKARAVVDDLSFTLEPRKITGFLGPNGSGKSTTMALMLGLVFGKGAVTFDGKKYVNLKDGPTRVGAYLGPGTFHPKYTARKHLTVSAFTRGVAIARVAEVLKMVGLESASTTRVKAMSTGMLQKLGIATAVLTNPDVLILDEPANGLDPQSVQWLRIFLNDFTKNGGTVLISSHLINEISLFADNLLVIAQGRLIASESLDTFLKRQRPVGFKVRTEQSEKFLQILNDSKLAAERVSEDVVLAKVVTSLDFMKVAVKNDIELLEVTPVGSSVEDIFLTLTAGKDDYSTTAGRLIAEGEK